MKENYADIKRMFLAFDKQMNGLITIESLRSVLTHFTIPMSDHLFLQLMDRLVELSPVCCCMPSYNNNIYLKSNIQVSKGNNLISKSRAFHNVGAAYTKDLSNNELAHVLLIGGTHNKQGSKDARVRIVVLLTLSLIKSN